MREPAQPCHLVVGPLRKGGARHAGGCLRADFSQLIEETRLRNGARPAAAQPADQGPGAVPCPAAAREPARAPGACYPAMDADADERTGSGSGLDASGGSSLDDPVSDSEGVAAEDA